MMPSLILNTCGTSLLTNGGISDDLRRLISKYSNYKQQDIEPDVFVNLQKHVEQRRQLLLQADEANAQKNSAELNSLLSWQSQHILNSQDIYYLLATDTYLGQYTADSIALWLQQRGCQTQVISSDGLNTASLQGFRQSLSSLVKQLAELFDGYRANGYAVYFNLTGGFKGLNGFLQALSTIYADQTFYLFESSQELLYIPKLPFLLDENIIHRHLYAFRRLSNDLPVQRNDWKEIPDSLLFQLDEQTVVLSEWGELLWHSGYKQIYQQELLDSISERVIYADTFEVSTKSLSPQILQIINERIAELASYTENDCKHALKSLDPKPLQEKQYKDRNLWECDLDPHHRIFMQKQGYSFVLEKVTKALH